MRRRKRTHATIKVAAAGKRQDSNTSYSSSDLSELSTAYVDQCFCTPILCLLSMLPNSKSTSKKKKWSKIFCRHKSARDLSVVCEEEKPQPVERVNSEKCVDKAEKMLREMEEETKKVVDDFMKSLQADNAEEDFIDITDEDSTTGRFYVTKDGRLICIDNKRRIQLITLTEMETEALMTEADCMSSSRVIFRSQEECREPERTVADKKKDLERKCSFPSFENSIRVIDAAKMRIYEILGMADDTKPTTSSHPLPRVTKSSARPSMSPWRQHLRSSSEVNLVTPDGPKTEITFHPECSEILASFDGVEMLASQKQPPFTTPKSSVETSSVFENPRPPGQDSSKHDTVNERLFFSADPPSLQSLLKRLASVESGVGKNPRERRRGIERRNSVRGEKTDVVSALKKYIYDQEGVEETGEEYVVMNFVVEAKKEQESKELTKYSVVAVTSSEEFNRHLRRLGSITCDEKVEKWLQDQPTPEEEMSRRNVKVYTDLLAPSVKPRQKDRDDKNDRINHA